MVTDNKPFVDKTSQLVLIITGTYTSDCRTGGPGCIACVRRLLRCSIGAYFTVARPPPLEVRIDWCRMVRRLEYILHNYNCLTTGKHRTEAQIGKTSNFLHGECHAYVRDGVVAGPNL